MKKNSFQRSVQRGIFLIFLWILSACKPDLYEAAICPEGNSNLFAETEQVLVITKSGPNSEPIETSLTVKKIGPGTYEFTNNEEPAIDVIKFCSARGFVFTEEKTSDDSGYYLNLWQVGPWLPVEGKGKSIEQRKVSLQFFKFDVELLSSLGIPFTQVNETSGKSWLHVRNQNLKDPTLILEASLGAASGAAAAGGTEVHLIQTRPAVSQQLEK